MKLFAVRKKMFLPEGWEHIDSIAPSAELLSHAKKLEKENNWNESTFHNFYESRFTEEMNKSNRAKEDLKRIVLELRNGKDVAFGCYCGNHLLCHRGIVGKWFEGLGFNVIYI
jgi:uncharacterized protein YeaO (DUF488 family)